MALHRDIFWVGRQWAVTGYGMQAVDQKQKGKFDIEASRVWEEGHAEALRAEGWLNIEDFDRALGVARDHFPLPPGTVPLLQADHADLNEMDVKQLDSKAQDSKQNPTEEPTLAPQKFNMQIEGWPAKFVKPWRIRARR